MVVEQSLTYSKAEKYIGKLLQIRGYLYEGKITGDFKDYFEEIKKYGEGDNFSFLNNGDLWDLTWIFNKDSKMVRCLEIWRKKQKELGIISGSDKVDEYFWDYHDARSKTNVLYAGGEYLDQLRGEDRITDVGDKRLSIQDSIRETLSNGIEHGSDFGRKGEVIFTFKGGENGALISVKDPGKGFELNPVTKEFLDSRPKQAFDESPKARGAGLINFTLNEDYFIGAENLDNGFRVTVLYPLE